MPQDKSLPASTPNSKSGAPQPTLPELTAIIDLAQRIITSPDIDSAIESVVDGTLRLVEAEVVTISLLNEPEPDVEVTRSGQIRTLAERRVDPADKRFRPFIRNIAGWIMKHRAALTSPGLIEDERFTGLALLTDHDFAAIGAPIRSGEDIIGTLIALQQRERYDGGRHALLLRQIAGLAAPAIAKLRRLQQLAEENAYLQQSVVAQAGFTGMVARSEAMQTVMALLQRIASNDVRVLIEGESGTGKELIARTLHYNGPRRDQKFLAVDCGAIPELLLESELFGYLKGAFTGAVRDRKGLFQEAEGGSIFLDEINNLPIHLQAKLLRVLQENEVRPVGSNEPVKVDVRVICASSRNLAELVKQQAFREDLYFRLKVVRVQLPPLRERHGDVPLLANHFLKEFNQKYDKHLSAIEPAAMKIMKDYRWPGNIRELEHAIEQAVVLAPPEATFLTRESLPEELTQRADAVQDASNESGDLATAVEQLEIRMIKKALDEARGNKSQAASRLGISRRGLLNKLERYGLQ